MRGHRQDSAQKWGLPCRWLFCFLSAKTGVKQTFVQTRSEVINHTKTIQESKTGVEFVPGSTHRTAQLQRTVPPMHPLLQSKFSHHSGGLLPLWKQAKHKVLKTHQNHCNFRWSVAVMKVSAAEIIAPHTRKKNKNTHLFPTEKVPIESYLANGVNRQRPALSSSKT